MRVALFGLLLLVGAFGALLWFTEPYGGFVPDDACIADLKTIATQLHYGERELGAPVSLGTTHETSGLYEGLGCVVIEATGTRSAGLIAIAAERGAADCIISFLRVHPPDEATCRALDTEARLRFTDLTP